MSKTSFFTASTVEVQNFKGVQDFKGRLNNECVMLLGSEGSGKTDIWLLLQMILSNYPSAIVTKGEEEGFAKVEISRDDETYLFDFSFDTKKNRPKLVTYANGVKITQAKQAHVIKCLTAPSFDIDKLITTTGRAQVDILLTALNVDISTEETLHKALFEERKEKRRDLEAVGTFVTKDKIQVVEKVDMTALLTSKDKIDKENAKLTADHEALKLSEMKVIQEHNLGVDRAAMDFKNAEMKVLNAQETIDITDKEISSLEVRLLKLQEEKKTFQTAKGLRQKELEKLPKPGEKKEEKVSLPEPILNDVRKLNADIAGADLGNKAYQDYLNAVANSEKGSKLLEEWKEVDQNVKSATRDILKKINEAPIPLEKLKVNVEINDNNGAMTTSLTYDGLPFDKESINEGERIAIGAKLQMELFKEGNLAIVLLNAGSIGNSTIQEIAEECSKRGIQALFELTSKDDDVSLTVESIFN